MCSSDLSSGGVTPPSESNQLNTYGQVMGTLSSMLGQRALNELKVGYAGLGQDTSQPYDNPLHPVGAAGPTLNFAGLTIASPRVLHPGGTLGERQHQGVIAAARQRFIDDQRGDFQNRPFTRGVPQLRLSVAALLHCDLRAGASAPFLAFALQIPEFSEGFAILVIEASGGGVISRELRVRASRVESVDRRAQFGAIYVLALSARLFAKPGERCSETIALDQAIAHEAQVPAGRQDRKSTRLNSSHT